MAEKDFQLLVSNIELGAAPEYLYAHNIAWHFDVSRYHDVRSFPSEMSHEPTQLYQYVLASSEAIITFKLLKRFVVWSKKSHCIIARVCDELEFFY